MRGMPDQSGSHGLTADARNTERRLDTPDLGSVAVGQCVCASP